MSIPVAPASVKINQGAFTLTKKGSHKKLTVTVSPSNAAHKAVTWSTSNPKVAKVDSTGKVTPVKNGTAYITAKTSNGKTAKVKVTVKITYPSSIKIATKPFTLTKKGATKTVKAKVSPSSATDKTITWSSSNSKVATVSSGGKVTAVKNGTASIRAKTANGRMASVKVTVKIPVAVTSVNIRQSSFTLTKKGASKQLSATVYPSNATNKKVTWRSSNSRVATVNSSGKVVAVGNGTATITAKSSNGRTAKVTVKVSIASASAKPGAYDMNADEYAVAKDIFNAYNNYRASRGYNRVKFDGGLCSWGVRVAKHCASAGKLEPWIAKIQTSRTENFSDILQYSTWKMKGTEAVQRWSKSNGHRKMMQCASATKAGVGVYKDKSKGIWYYAIIYDYKGTNQSGN